MGKLYFVVLVSVCACVAQTPQPLRGEITTDGTQDLSWLSVRLESSGVFRGEATPVSYNGDFEFSNG